MLIKCPECGKEVSNKSDKCIKCGYPIYLMVSQNKGKKKCSYCGFENSYFSSECEKCGAILEETDKKKNDNMQEAENTKKKLEDEIREKNMQKLMEKYFCLNCNNQNEIGEDYCIFCGYRLTPYRRG